MSQSYARMNAPYTTMYAHTPLNVFRVQLYKNNARALLSHILSIVNSDWLQHVRCVHGMYKTLFYPN